jgi:hypothetical protein
MFELMDNNVDGMDFIIYHQLPSILFISLLKYSNNEMEDLFQSILISFHSILLRSIPFYSIDPNIDLFVSK